VLILLLTSWLTVTAAAFAPPSSALLPKGGRAAASSCRSTSTTATTTTSITQQHNLLPSTLSIDLPLWLVDASSKVDESIQRTSTLLSSSLPAADDSSLQAAQQQIVSTLSSALNWNIDTTGDQYTSLLAAATAPWHLQLVTAAYRQRVSLLAECPRW
jgi:hypothetical protein